MPKHLNSQDRLRLRMQGKSFDDGTRITNDDSMEDQDPITKSVIDLSKHSAVLTKSLTEMQRIISASMDSMSSILTIQTDAIKAIAQAIENGREKPKGSHRYVFDVRREDGKIKQIIATTKEEK